MQRGTGPAGRRAAAQPAQGAASAARMREQPSRRRRIAVAISIAPSSIVLRSPRIIVVSSSRRGKASPAAPAPAQRRTPSTMETTNRGTPPSDPPVGARRRNTASPMTPPKPVGSGQGRCAAGRRRNRRRETRRRTTEVAQPLAVERAMGNSRHPQKASGSSSGSAARPNSCIARSAATAPGSRADCAPEPRWRGSARVLDRPGRERDAADQGERDQREPGDLAHAPAQPSRRSSETKATTSRLRSSGHRLTPLSAEHGDEAMQRLRRGLLVLHHGDADIVRAGIVPSACSRAR